MRTDLIQSGRAAQERFDGKRLYDTARNYSRLFGGVMVRLRIAHDINGFHFFEVALREVTACLMARASS